MEIGGEESDLSGGVVGWESSGRIDEFGSIGNTSGVGLSVIEEATRESSDIDVGTGSTSGGSDRWSGYDIDDTPGDGLGNHTIVVSFDVGDERITRGCVDGT